MTNETKKRNKKKMLIIALFLFAVVGIAGYGVYSYYWTEGDFSAGADRIYITSFNPRVYVSNGDSFLGDGGSVSLDCPDPEYSGTGTGTTITCTADLVVTNSGEVPFDLEVLNQNGERDLEFEYSWEDSEEHNGVITLHDSDTLHIEKEVDLGTYVYSSNPVEATGPSSNSYVDVTVDFKLRATQVHD